MSLNSIVENISKRTSKYSAKYRELKGEHLKKYLDVTNVTTSGPSGVTPVWLDIEHNEQINKKQSIADKIGIIAPALGVGIDFIEATINSNLKISDNILQRMDNLGIKYEDILKANNFDDTEKQQRNSPFKPLNIASTSTGKLSVLTKKEHEAMLKNKK